MVMLKPDVSSETEEVLAFVGLKDFPEVPLPATPISEVAFSGPRKMTGKALRVLDEMYGAGTVLLCMTSKALLVQFDRHQEPRWVSLDL